MGEERYTTELDVILPVALDPDISPSYLEDATGTSEPLQKAYVEVGPFVLGVLGSMVGHYAEDALQEATLRTLLEIKGGASIENIAGFIYRTAYNLAVDVKRGHKGIKGRELISDLQEMDEEPNGDRLSVEDLAILHVDIERAIQQLPENQQLAVRKFYLEDMPIPKVAAELKTEEITVRVHLWRGRRSLADKLRRRRIMI